MSANEWTADELHLLPVVPGIYYTERKPRRSTSILGAGSYTVVVLVVLDALWYYKLD